jgi:succinate-semialdehyde dehydrogenase/glutarate-semialdehyde dehydrogenase
MAIVTSVETPAGARRRLALASPATLAPLGEIEVLGEPDVRAAVERARKAQPDWGALPVRERAALLERAVGILAERQDHFVDVVVSESGKPRNEARMMEIFAGCDHLHYWAKRAPRLLRPERRRLHGVLRLAKRLDLVYKPLGVVGVISPWNGPFILGLVPTAQALLAGNAVLLKPSEVTPRSGALVGELFEAAGLPEGVLQILPGDGETGAALVRAGVDKIAFTGSVATGRRVALACAEALVPCSLELGGKDPMIVCADADLERAAAGAVAGAFLNTGHYCCGTERVYVVDAVADELERRVVERTRALRQAAEGEFDVGPIFWPRQLEIVERQMADAVAKGARVLAGGRRNPALRGLYYEPTVVAGVTHDMLLMREETFGPVLPIVRVRDDDEAVRMANDCDYGLGANVWTRDPARAAALARRIDSGSVCVNDMTMTFGVPEAPFGGRKSSGVGQVNGDAGLRAWTWPTPILTDRMGGKQSLSHYPYAAARDAGMAKFIKLLFGTRLGRWLA